MMRDPKIETMSRPELEKLQLSRLKNKVKEVYEKVPFYRKAFKEKGIVPRVLMSPGTMPFSLNALR